MTHWTTISARTAMERSFFYDSKVSVSCPTTGTNRNSGYWGQSVQPQTNYYYPELKIAAASTTDTTGFHPACYIAFEADQPPVLSTFLNLKIRAKWHFTFRSPGAVASSAMDIRYLLRTNDAYIPYDSAHSPLASLQREIDEERALGLEEKRARTVALPELGDDAMEEEELEEEDNE